MSKEVEIKPETLRIESRAGEVQDQLSIYDVPTVASVEHDGRSGVLQITFRYLDPEDGEPKEINHRLRFFVGKHSGKILRLEVQVGSEKDPKTFLIPVQQAERIIRDEIPNLRRFNEKANYGVIMRVLRNQSQQLVEAAT